WARGASHASSEASTFEASTPAGTTSSRAPASRVLRTSPADAFRIHHIDYYDRQNRLLKTLEVEGYTQHADRFWKPQRMLMANVQTGKSTELEWRNFEFGTGLDAERDFSTTSLRRAR
ncbi:MAG: outer membrane lipoprotein-sorting protein, partial [Gammaproteobacteria bacterium]